MLRGTMKSRLHHILVIFCILSAAETAFTADVFPLHGGGTTGRRSELARTESCLRVTEACLTAKTRPVCASDGLTYSSKCEIRRIRRCERTLLAVVSNGHCPIERSGTSGCLEQRHLAIQEATRRQDVYVPRCSTDGRYTSEQCHNATGYCWCVTSEGKPIPGSSTHGRQVSCAAYFAEDHRVSSRRGNRRRQRSGGRSSRTRGSRRRQAVPVGTRPKSVYDSLRAGRRRTHGDNTATSDNDNAGHSLLDLINSKVSMRLNHTSAAGHVTRSDDHSRSRRRQRNNVVDHSTDSANSAVGAGGQTRSRCTEARARAIQLDRADPEGHIFIPVCQRGSASLYRTAQCHAATGYCWCVDEITGIPIPGFSTRDVTPNCTQLNIKTFKVCPPSARRKFLSELFDLLTQEMVASVNNGSFIRVNDADPGLSIEEQAVRWKLRQLDANKNNVLERRELKSFKADIKSLHADDKFGRKCRRHFLRQCDNDGDKRITVDEWIECTHINERTMNVAEQRRRRGRNPFSTVLKS